MGWEGREVECSEVHLGSPLTHTEQSGGSLSLSNLV